MAYQLARQAPRRLASGCLAGYRAEVGATSTRRIFRRQTSLGAARPLRFAITGTLAGLTQMALLALLTGRGWPPLGANTIAFLLAAQLNFVLSNLFTWRDRRQTASLWRRWLLFHGAIAGMAAVNLVVFTVIGLLLPTLLASAAGIGAAAIGNYILGDRMVFRGRPRAARVLHTGPLVTR